MSITFYAPTFLDFSLTRPDRRGCQEPTGDLNGMVFARTFYKKGKSIRARRNLISFSWEADTPDAKADALAKVVEGMEELPELDKNPALNWIPQTVKERLS